ncbi:transposase [Microbacterium azadirachtae]|uniref:Transposase n=1 Tax=Microbacterium azadirachtae TaxID=582680 RepID=A0A1I6G8B9_9MICO|nr:transposase [Microbacterium azadirachtae]SDL37427.1 transposase [Microbacterium azadirachtae]SEF68309.1 transposase [Microbacterium azadirachtae]SEF69000.1 transposase [Microbacterium azadirachtae]SFR38439.1 transposase [Microbacterium azadirachtae]
MPRKYPQSFKDRAVRMVSDRLESDEDGLSSYQVIKVTAPKLNISVESLRRWVEQASVDSGTKLGITTDAQAEIRRLRRENAELRRANEILKTASALFAAELDRPTPR